MSEVQERGGCPHGELFSGECPQCKQQRETELESSAQKLRAHMLETDDPLCDAGTNREVYDVWCSHRLYIDQCDECRQSARNRALEQKEHYQKTVAEVQSNWESNNGTFQDNDGARRLDIYQDTLARAQDDYYQALLQIRSEMLKTLD